MAKLVTVDAPFSSILLGVTSYTDQGLSVAVAQNSIIPEEAVNIAVRPARTNELPVPIDVVTEDTAWVYYVGHDMEVYLTSDGVSDILATFVVGNV